MANGLLREEVDLPGGLRRTHWQQSVPIASWLFTIGVARFSVHHYDVVRGIPQQVWVFPQDRDKGYALFELTGRRAFEFFSDQVGPYAYEKLAHVEAAGVSGGMESATSIFYGEKNVAGGRAPVVHEVAHQWFGNAVTEKDWDDVWLSEGFATYFTHLYAEQFSGRDEFVRGLKADIARIVEAQHRAPDQPVIHRNISDMSTVLNRLVYQKAGWVLHMLRAAMGTEKFWTGIREYYRRYRNLNASTDDFRQVMEQAAGTDLSWFFDQWLRRPGMPRLKGSWRYDPAARQIQIELAQAQTEPAFRLPIEIGITGPKDHDADRASRAVTGHRPVHDPSRRRALVGRAGPEYVGADGDAGVREAVTTEIRRLEQEDRRSGDFFLKRVLFVSGLGVVDRELRHAHIPSSVREDFRHRGGRVVCGPGGCATRQRPADCSPIHRRAEAVSRPGGADFTSGPTSSAATRPRSPRACASATSR